MSASNPDAPRCPSCGTALVVRGGRWSCPNWCGEDDPRPRRLRVSREPGYWYVSIRDGGRLGFLAGPFRYHRQALRFLRATRREAERVDHWAAFSAIGTCRCPDGRYTGVLNGALGIARTAR